MKFLIQWTLILSTLFQPLIAGAALTDFDRQEVSFKNFLAPYNSGFESGKAQWTASGGTLAVVTSGSNLLDGKTSITWDASASGQTLSSKAVTLEKGYYGRNCSAEIVTQVPSGTATHSIQAYDGTNILATATIVSSTLPYNNVVNFPCPQSGTVLLRAYANADEPLIAADLSYLGLARNVGSTQLIGEWTSYTPTIGLTGGSTTAYGKYRRVGDSVEVQYDATFTTVFTGGTASVSIPSVCSAIDTAKLPTGYATGVGLPNSNARFYDVGTGQWGGSIVYNDTTTVLMRTWTDDVGAGGNHVQVDAVISTTIPFTWANNDRVSGYFKVPCVGWQAQTLVMPDAQGWYVDASISGANPSLGTSSVTSYTGIENGSLTMTQASGSAAVQIGCSSTNAPSGLTCSSGNESLSVAFTPPKSGAYRACVTANHYIDAPAGSINVVSTFQIVETATNAQTILQEGKGKAMSGSVSISGDRREYRSVATCGDFVFSSVGQKMLRLMYETEISGTPDSHYIKADADSVLGQPDVHWTIFPLSQQQQAVLANSASTGANNGVKLDAALIDNNGASASITSQSATMVSSVNRSSTGRVTVTLSTGYFSATPWCSCSTYGSDRSCSLQIASSTSISVATANSSGVSDTAFYLMCTGPR